MNDKLRAAILDAWHEAAVLNKNKNEAAQMMADRITREFCVGEYHVFECLVCKRPESICQQCGVAKEEE